MSESSLVTFYLIHQGRVSQSNSEWLALNSQFALAILGSYLLRARVTGRQPHPADISVALRIQALVLMLAHCKGFNP